MITLLSKWGTPNRTCALVLAGTLISANAHACYAPSAGQTMTPDELIAQATDVSVARVIRAIPLPAAAPGERVPVEYQFDVDQRILGPDTQRFSVIVVGKPESKRREQLSRDHSDSAFWKPGGGSLTYDNDCVMRPDFTVGEYYLVFRKGSPTWRSFEHIETARGRPDPNDKWLTYVEDQLKGRQ